MPRYAIGLDYGTSSVRTLLVNVENGDEVATHVYAYPHGTDGVILGEDPHLARQHPQDYIDGLLEGLRTVALAVNPADIIGIGVDTTGSSPMPVDARNQPLAFSREEPAALVWLWKDHTSHAEANEITEKARSFPYLAKCGGAYSSEWFWSKILHCARTAPETFAAAHSWVEICDWIPSYLAGIEDPVQIQRSVCAAGHKAMYADDWGGLPSEEFLQTLDPRLAELRPRLYEKAVTSDQIAGRLQRAVADKTGLLPRIPVAVGAFDAHFGAVASGAKPGTLVKIVGTSTCDCMVHPESEPLADIAGVCGIVRGSILPGYYGIEAGQSAVGDIFHWFAQFVEESQEELSARALELRPGESGLLALDWHNGNRTILVDPLLSGLVIGQTLRTTPAETYRAYVEATAFGARRIIDRIEEYGVQVEEVVNCGGIAEKSALVMQVYADVMNRSMKISRSAQTCALGSAVFASVAGGAHSDVATAQAAMTGVKEQVYRPDPDAVAVYEQLYGLYKDLHDAFGGVEARDLSGVMKKLIEIREAA